MGDEEVLIFFPKGYPDIYDISLYPFLPPIPHLCFFFGIMSALWSMILSAR
jgi:hypothetical protein